MTKTKAFLGACLKCIGYVALFIAVQIGAGYLAQFLILMNAPAGLTEGEFSQWFLTAYYSRVYEIMLLEEVVFLAILTLILRRKTLQDCGINKVGAAPVISGTFLGVGIFPIASFLVFFLSAFSAYSDSAQDYMAHEYAVMAAQPSLFFEILVTCITGPFVEEIVFRGLVQKQLLKGSPAPVAIFLSGLSFSLFHGNLYQMAFTLPLGLILGYLAYRFDSVWPSVALHMAFNSCNYFPDVLFELLLFALPVGLFVLAFALNRYPKKQKEPVLESAASYYETSSYPLETGEFMAAPEFLVVGLGNPGDKYEKTRHNCGFLAMDFIAEKERTSVKELKFRSLVGEGTVQGKKVLFMKPQTFMNLSGEAVIQAASFYKIPPEKILVIYDDVNFSPGSFRIRLSGSAGGHNGIKSIISCLGSDGFPRIKVGVGQLPEGWDMMNWVLSRFQGEEMEKISSCFEDIHATVELFVQGNLNEAMQRFNGKTR